MDIYCTLNLAVPQLLFTVLHQAGPTVSEEEFTRTVTALQLDIRHQAQAVGEEMHRWLEQQYTQRAGETIRQLQHLSTLAGQVDLEQVQETLLRDYQQLGNDINTESVLGMEGSAEEAFREEVPSHPDLARRFADGREYLACCFVARSITISWSILCVIAWASTGGATGPTSSMSPVPCSAPIT